MARHPIGMNVGVSATDAGLSAARHLIERGHRSIGFLCARQSSGCCGSACAGLAEGAAGQLPLRTPSSIPLSCRVSARGGHAGEFLLRWPELDALICVNDELAAGVLFECQRHHLSVPGKLAIAGFDDLGCARACHPALTSVRIPITRWAGRRRS